MKTNHETHKEMTIFYDQKQFEGSSFNKKKVINEIQQAKQPEMESAVCNFCSQIILDQFYFEVDGLLWHSSCLRCNACQVSLSSMRSCFAKNKKFWCRQDYDRQFKCQKCCEPLKSSDLIMRSGSSGLPYHVGCFRCDLCNVLLLAGDFYGCSNNQLFCKNDFLVTQRAANNRSENWRYSTETVPMNVADVNGNLPTVTDNPLSALCQLNVDEYLRNKTSTSVVPLIDKINLSSKLMSQSIDERKIIPYNSLLETESPNTKEYTSLTSCKIITEPNSNYDDQELSEESLPDKIHGVNQIKLENTSSPNSNYEVDEKNLDETVESNEMSSETDMGKELIDHSSMHEASTLGTEDDDGSGGSCCESEDKIVLSTKQGMTKKGSNNLRQKRVRTSFKHQQLRTMKAYFSMNHNPDSKDLRQLSQKTGLSKRVLQVWFQNARAKFRRSLCRQTGVMCGPSANQIQMPNVFDDTSLISIDKNGNYSTKTTMATFNDISSSILNHSVQNNHRLCSLNDINYQNPTNNGLLQQSTMSNLRDRYFPNGKQSFIPVTSYYNNTINPVSQSSPSLFSMDVGSLAVNLGLAEFPRDTGDSFHLTEIGMGQKISSI